MDSLFSDIRKQISVSNFLLAFEFSPSLPCIPRVDHWPIVSCSLYNLELLKVLSVGALVESLHPPIKSLLPVKIQQLKESGAKFAENIKYRDSLQEKIKVLMNDNRAKLKAELMADF